MKEKSEVFVWVFGDGGVFFWGREYRRRSRNGEMEVGKSEGRIMRLVWDMLSLRSLWNN